MPWTLINTKTESYNALDCAIMFNNEKHTSYIDFGTLTASVTISVITSVLLKPINKNFAPWVQACLEGVGIFLGIDSILTAMANNDIASQRNAILQQMKNNNGAGLMKVVTQIYEYDTGSGNASTWKSVMQYLYEA
ncbi:hypothetical protein SAMN05443428_10167 [Caloramator quimbayensis]|uniref:Uncharacterized protein n=1 Tax=Caloramator quimbayensis TaxID=1147123 RepID=A0A1T4WFI6_9CLOT|nr:hypothetical protein [Caloramator quimbayensis]SKA75665.1 hypothetical protein SAMN05443428_10167 [Caloramator quimbayensis]